MSILRDPNAFLEALHVAYECAKLDTTQRLTTLVKLGALIRELASGLGHGNLLAYHSLECGNPIATDVEHVTNEHKIFDVIKACEMALKGTLTEEYLPKVLGRVVCDDMYRIESSNSSICDWASDVLRCCHELSPMRAFADLDDNINLRSDRDRYRICLLYTSPSPRDS